MASKNSPSISPSISSTLAWKARAESPTCETLEVESCSSVKLTSYTLVLDAVLPDWNSLKNLLPRSRNALTTGLYFKSPWCSSKIRFLSSACKVLWRNKTYACTSSKAVFREMSSTKLFSILARKLSWDSSGFCTVPYKAFSKYSYRSSISVDPHDPPIASTNKATPAVVDVFSFAGSKRAILRKAVPSTNNAALGANKGRDSTGHMAARNFNFCVYSWTFVTPGVNFGILAQGSWGARLVPACTSEPCDISMSMMARSQNWWCRRRGPGAQSTVTRPNRNSVRGPRIAALTAHQKREKFKMLELH